jgi:hypothetical protein
MATRVIGESWLKKPDSTWVQYAIMKRWCAKFGTVATSAPTPSPIFADGFNNHWISLKAEDPVDFEPSPGLQCVACEFFNECKGGAL